MAEIEPGETVDLVELGYRFMVYLAVAFAGIDRSEGTSEEREALIHTLRMFGVAATLGQAVDRDVAAARKEVQAAIDEFDRRFLRPLQSVACN